MRARRLSVASVAAFCVIALSALTAPRADAHEYVDNGGFETGTSGWSARQDTQLTSVDASVAEPASGERSGKVTASDDRFEVRSAANAISGSGTYVLSAMLRATSTSAEVHVEARGEGFAPWNDVRLTPGGWTPVSVAIDAPHAGRIAIIISGSGLAGSELYIDDVRLDGAPPVTFTPTATGAPMTTPAVHASAGTATTAAATASPTAEPTPGATLRNASFEETRGDGTIVAWDNYGGILSASAHARSGERAARLASATDSTKWLHQVVRVRSEETYAFGAWVWDDDPNVAAAFLRVSWYTSEDGSGTAITSVDSTERLTTPEGAYRGLTTGAVAAPPTARSAKVRVMLAPATDAGAAIYVDDTTFGMAAGPAPPASVGDASDGEADERRASARPPQTARGSAAPYDGAAVASLYEGARTLVINEVLYDPDFDGADADGEWVELYNAGAAPVSLDGWTLRDGVRSESLPDLAIGAHEYAIIAASDSFIRNDPGFTGLLAWLDGRIGNGLGNDGDSLALAAPDGSIVDAVSWGEAANAPDPPVGDVPEGHSIERAVAGQDSDRADDFLDNAEPSPGRAYDASSGNPKREPATNVQIIDAEHAAWPRWAPWALVAASAAALAAAAGWRMLDGDSRGGPA